MAGIIVTPTSTIVHIYTYIFSYPKKTLNNHGVSTGLCSSRTVLSKQGTTLVIFTVFSFLVAVPSLSERRSTTGPAKIDWLWPAIGGNQWEILKKLVHGIRNHLQINFQNLLEGSKSQIVTFLDFCLGRFPSKPLKDFPLLNLKVPAAEYVSFSVDRIISPFFMSCWHQCEDHMLGQIS